MKKLQSYEQFEQELRKERTPELDIERLKAKVLETGCENKKSVFGRRRMRVVIITLILTLCIGSVGMAVYNKWVLTDKKGNVVYEYSKLENAEVFKSMDAAFRESEIFTGDKETKILEALKPGEMTYVVTTEAYEMDQHYSVLQREDKIYDIKKLINGTSTKFKIPQDLPDSYKFKYGTIRYKVNGDEKKEAKALYEKAKENKLQYITQKGTLSKEIYYLVLKYINKEGFMLVVYIHPWDKAKSMTSDIDKIEKFRVADKEVLKIKSNPYEYDEYIFVDTKNGQKLTYCITNNSGGEVFFLDSDKTFKELTKTEAIKMIRSFQ